MRPTTPATTSTPPLTNPADFLVARARSLELDTPYVPPPGDPLEHHAAGFAKVMCSAVFVTGLDPDFAAEHVGYFTAPYEARAHLGKPVIDRAARAVHVTLPSGVRRTAVHLGDQGCLTLPRGHDAPAFTPVRVASTLPDAATHPWPMGDVLPEDPMPAALDMATVKRAVDAAFEPAAAMTAALVVTWKGRVIGERYGHGITMHTPLESWSMGKSLTATLMGILIAQGVYDLEQPAPIPEWQAPNDPRARIRIADLLNMSSGVRSRAPMDPDYDPAGPYPDHLYLYTGPINAFQYAATRPLQWPPGTVGRYRNIDVALTNYLIRLAVEKRGEEYWSFPRRALFDRLGIRTMVMDTDTLREFPHPGLRARLGARLGTARQPLSARWRVERPAHPARGFCQLCEHGGAGLGRGPTSRLRGLLLDQRRRPVPRAVRRVFHGGGRGPVHAHRAVARSRGGAARSLQRRRTRHAQPRQRACPAAAGGAQEHRGER